MNVLSVNKFFWKKGGSEAVFFSEIEMLESAGHRVAPFSMHSVNNIQSDYSKFFINEIDYSSPRLITRLGAAAKIIYSFEAKKKMERLLLDFIPDIAHFHIFQHQISPSVFSPLRAKKVPLVLTLHDLKPICPNYKMYVGGKVCEECHGGRFYNCFKNKCTKGSTLMSLVNTVEMYFHYAMGYYQSVDRYIAVSHFYRNKMIEYGFAPEKIDYLPNYVDCSQFNAGAEDGSYVLYFGRLSEEKGVSILLDAAATLKRVQFKIVGTGPLELVLRQKASSEALTNVQFLGFKSGEELKSILQGATAVVVPSEWYENCPMTILESYAAGRPVIGANIGGIPELIESEVDGLVFHTGDAESLAGAIDTLWSNRGRARAMGSAGREKIEQCYNAQVHYDGLMTIYNSVLSSHSV